VVPYTLSVGFITGSMRHQDPGLTLQFRMWWMWRILKTHCGAGSMMSPRINHRLLYRFVNTPTVPGIRDQYHRLVSHKFGQGAVSIQDYYW